MGVLKGIKMINRRHSDLLIVPEIKERRRIKAQCSGLEGYSPLLVVKDIVDVERYASGYIAAKRNAVRFNDIPLDVAAGHLTSETGLYSYYNIPILSCDADCNEAIFREVLEEFSRKPGSRYFVKVLGTPEPFLVDAYVDGSLKCTFTSFLKSDFESMSREGKEGQRLRKRLEVLADELSSSL